MCVCMLLKKPIHPTLFSTIVLPDRFFAVSFTGDPWHAASCKESWCSIPSSLLDLQPLKLCPSVEQDTLNCWVSLLKLGSWPHPLISCAFRRPNWVYLVSLHFRPWSVPSSGQQWISWRAMWNWGGGGEDSTIWWVLRILFTFLDASPEVHGLSAYLHPSCKTQKLCWLAGLLKCRQDGMYDIIYILNTKRTT